MDPMDDFLRWKRGEIRVTLLSGEELLECKAHPQKKNKEKNRHNQKQNNHPADFQTSPPNKKTNATQPCWDDVWNTLVYIYIPGTCLSSILGFEPSKRRPFPFKTRVIWVPGIYSGINDNWFCCWMISIHMIPFGNRNPKAAGMFFNDWVGSRPVNWEVEIYPATPLKTNMVHLKVMVSKFGIFSWKTFNLGCVPVDIWNRLSVHIERA